MLTCELQTAKATEVSLHRQASEATTRIPAAAAPRAAREARRKLRYFVALLLLYWYKSTNTDTGDANSATANQLEQELARKADDLQQLSGVSIYTFVLVKQVN